MNRAVDLLAKKLAGVRTLGPHPKTGEPVMVASVAASDRTCSTASMVANLPRGVAMEDLTLDEAVALLAEHGKPLKAKGRKAAAKKAAPPAKAAAEPRKAPAKKAAPKKAARKAPAKKAAAKRKAG